MKIDIRTRGFRPTAALSAHVEREVTRSLSRVRHRPAAILGFPVGFVGAAESKALLIEAGLGIPYVTLQGRRGGSAMAAAAVNALLIGDGPA